ncbi:MAG: hypothetical protein ACP5XB_02200 [Isosphaeraceae bacterium]
MRSQRPRESDVETSQPGARPGKTRRVHTGVRWPVIVVACSTVFGWAAWSSWKIWSPVGVPALYLRYGIGSAAEPAIPALIQVLRQSFARKDGYAFNEAEAVRAMAKIAPGTRSADMALAALIEVLKQRPEVSESNPAQSLLITRLAIFEAIPKFGPIAVAAIPQIRAWRNDSDDSLKRAASRALKAIEGARPRNGRNDGITSGGRTPP